MEKFIEILNELKELNHVEDQKPKQNNRAFSRRVYAIIQKRQPTDVKEG